MRALLRRIFIVFAALLLLFEEWGWEPLAALVARLANRGDDSESTIIAPDGDLSEWTAE